MLDTAAAERFTARLKAVLLIAGVMSAWYGEEILIDPGTWVYADLACLGAGPNVVVPFGRRPRRLSANQRAANRNRARNRATRRTRRRDLWLSAGQAEPLGVYLGAGHVQRAEAAEYRRGHGWRAADEDVAVGDVGHHGEEVPRVERLVRW